MPRMACHGGALPGGGASVVADSRRRWVWVGPKANDVEGWKTCSDFFP